jgi:hypothetical protein
VGARLLQHGGRPQPVAQPVSQPSRRCRSLFTVFTYLWLT